MVDRILKAGWLLLAGYVTYHAVDISEAYILIRLHEAQLYERSIRILESRYDMEFPRPEEDKKT